MAGQSQNILESKSPEVERTFEINWFKPSVVPNTYNPSEGWGRTEVGSEAIWLQDKACRTKKKKSSSPGFSTLTMGQEKPKERVPKEDEKATTMI